MHGNSTTCNGENYVPKQLQCRIGKSLIKSIHDFSKDEVIVHFWGVSVDLFKCGYFTISLTTTLSTTLRLPNISHYYWPTLPGFQAPLQGADYLQDLTHTITTTWNSSHVIAHYNPSQYIINRMNYFARQIYSMERYATQTSLIAFMKEPCQRINITMDIIQRSTGDIYGYAFHHFVYHLTLKLNSEFIFTDYLPAI